MKKVTAHFNTGAGLVAQTFEAYDDFTPQKLIDKPYVELEVLHRGGALIRVADVAFWTYD